MFNRGRARSVWPGGVEVLTGDRSADLGPLAGRRWDAVIDTCGDVQASAEALHGCGRYLFVSSVSADATTSQVPVRETGALASSEGIARDAAGSMVHARGVTYVPRKRLATAPTGGLMHDDKFYEEFAAEWIASWNSHDSRRILSNYDGSFGFSSPVLANVSSASGGKHRPAKALLPSSVAHVIR